MRLRPAPVYCFLVVVAAAAGWMGAVQAAAPAAGGTHDVATRPLPFLHDLFTFRGENGGTVLVAAYAVEAGQLERESTAGGVRYRFDVSLVLTDTLRRIVDGRHDSVYVDVARPLPPDHLLFTTVEMLARPSGTTLQRFYMYNATSPGIGQFYTTSLTIPDYSGTHLMLSDIALGQPDAVTGWQRGGATLALLPTRQFPGSAFDAYYEIYNLPRDHDIRTEIAVAALAEEGGAERELARLRFDSEAPSGGRTVLPQLRRVESSLERGRYRITVTVTDVATGRSASSSRTFEVHAGRRDATMVPALPVAATQGAR